MSTRQEFLLQTVKEFERLSKRKITSKELTWLFSQSSLLPLRKGEEPATSKPIQAYVIEYIERLNNMHSKQGVV